MIVQTNLTTDAPSQMAAVARPNGFLTVALEQLGFSDALRIRLRQLGRGEEQVATYKSKLAKQGSYLDRILIRGATVLRAGALSKEELLSIIKVDHSLIVADVNCGVLDQLDSQCQTKRPTAALSRAFLDMAHFSPGSCEEKEFYKNIKDNTPPKALDVADALTAKTEEMLLLPSPRTREEHSEQLEDLEVILKSFLADVYIPTLASITCKKSAGGRGYNDDPRNSLEFRTLLIELNLACKQEKGTRIQLEGPVANRHTCTTAPPASVATLAAYLHNSWLELCSFAIPEVNAEQLMGQQTYDKLLLLRISSEEGEDAVKTLRECQVAAKVGIPAIMTRLHQRSATRWLDAVRYNFNCGRIRKVFQLQSDRKRKKPASTLVTSEEDAREAVRQEYSALYGINRFKPPPFMDIRKNHRITGHGSAAIRDLSLQQIETLSDEERIAYNAFQQTRSSSHDWDKIQAPLNTQELSYIFRARRGQAPGSSGIKLATIQYLHPSIEKAISGILQVMWCRQLFPSSLLTVLVCLISKPTGGSRGISLMEEIVKALEHVLARRLVTDFLQGKGIDDFLSPLNRAYKHNMGCEDILHAHALVTHDAVSRGKPLILIMTDLAKFFDTVQLDVVESVLRLKGATDPIIAMVRAMYHKSQLKIATQFGDTAVIQRKIGIQQGGALSCILCLLCLEPLHRAQELLQTLHDPYIVGPPGGTQNVTALSLAYCDDHNDQCSTVAGLQARADAVSPILTALGIGIDKKVVCIAFNIPLHENMVITLRSYNYLTGTHGTLNIPIADGTVTTYRLLGVHFRGAYTEPSIHGALAANTCKQIRRIGYQKLPFPVMRQIVRQRICTSAAGYAVLFQRLDCKALSRLDTCIADAARHTARLPTSAPRAIAFADERDGGLHFSSITTEALASTARTICVLLNQSDSTGQMARLCFGQSTTMVKQRAYKPACFLDKSIQFLAEFGFFVTATAEPIINRVLHNTLTKLSQVNTHYSIPSPTARHDETTLQRSNLSRFSAIKKSIQFLRYYMQGHPLVISYTKQASPFAAQPTTAPQGLFHMKLLPQAVADAQHGERNDVASLFAAMGITSKDYSWVPGDCLYDPTSSKSARNLTRLVSAINGPTIQKTVRLIDAHVGARHFLSTATDGSDFAAAWILAAPPASCTVMTNHNDIVAETFGTYQESTRVHKTIAEHTMHAPARIGSLKICSYDTEMFGQLHDLLIRCGVASSRGPFLGPCFLDNQSVQHRVSMQRSSATLRDALAESRFYLHIPLDHLQQELTLRHKNSNTPPHPFIADILAAQFSQWNYNPACNEDIPRMVLPGVDGAKYYLCKIKSHQPLQSINGRLNAPCALGHALNNQADKCADKASKTSQVMSTGNVAFNPFPLAFELVHNAVSITGSPARFIRSTSRELTAQHLANEVERPKAGALMRLRTYVHPVALHLTKCFLPKDMPPANFEATSILGNALCHYLHLPSWTHLVHMNEFKANQVEDDFQTVYGPLLESMYPLPFAVYELCPLCLSLGLVCRGGADHFSSVLGHSRCLNTHIRDAILEVCQVTENSLLQIAPLAAWVAHGSNCNRKRSSTISATEEQKGIMAAFPALYAVGWVAITDHTQPGAETDIYQLGMRAGSFPLSLTLPSFDGRPSRRLLAEEVQRIEQDKFFLIFILVRLPFGTIKMEMKYQKQKIKK